MLVNDTASPGTRVLQVSRRGFDGTTLADAKQDVLVGPRGTLSVTVPAELAMAAEPGAELLLAEVASDETSGRGWWFFAEPRDSALTAADTTVETTRTPAGYDVRVRTNVLVRDLTLLVDTVDPDAVVDSMLHTLLPGESIVFEVSTDRETTTDEFAAALRSANQLVVR